MSENTAVVILRFSDETCKVKVVSNIYDLYWYNQTASYADVVSKHQVLLEFLHFELLEWMDALLTAADLFLEFPRESGIQIIEVPFTWEECVIGEKQQ